MNLLLTDAKRYNDEEKARINAIGYNVFYVDHERESLTMQNPAISIEDIDVIGCYSLFRHHDIQQFKQLRHVQLYSSGMDTLPLEYMHNHRITLNNAKDIYSIPIAEYIVLKILEFNKHSRQFDTHQQKRLWKRDRHLKELTDQRVLIVGYGSIGVETAKRLQPFGVRMDAVVQSRVNHPHQDYVDTVHPVSALPELWATADIIILSLPYDTSSHHMINEASLQLIRDDAILINVSRGKIIDESALIQSLKARKFKGVALDVFYEEPLQRNSPLWRMPNVSITPHNSNVSQHVKWRLNEYVYQQLKSYYDKHK